MSSSLSEPRRPRLLPQNRKLRHVKGIWLRNLCFAPTHLRSADDAGLNTTPNKLHVLREGNQLQGSKSSDSLHSLRQMPSSTNANDKKAQTRPLRPLQKRRTSLSLAHANANARQKKLEALVEDSVGDAFFSLHVVDEEEPVYISEVRQRSANYNFHFFDLANRDARISRRCALNVRIWAKKPKSDSWVFLLDEFIDLRRLNFIGTLMDRRFPPNALVFHLEDGVYSLDFPNKISEPKQAPAMATSSYNALMKLANLEASIEDAMETQHRIMEEINAILEESPIDASQAANEHVVLAAKYVATQQRANQIAQRKRDDLQDSIKSRKEAIVRGRQVQREAEDDIANSKEKLEAAKVLIDKTELQIRGQRRRICSELTDMFPITPIPNAPPLSFQICNLPLPNSTYDASIARSISEDALSAALGLVALLTRHLQFYLGYPLPYPLQVFGSRSYARDDISHLADKSNLRRDFPLYLPRGGSTAGQWRFEYGWFLLNKDIETLCSSQGLKVVDIRHSLPNLKYLLYVCSAGTDEVPERKKGGVRGLWAGRLKGRMSTLSTQMDDEASSLTSRRGSYDSEVTQYQVSPSAVHVSTKDTKSNGGLVLHENAMMNPNEDTIKSLPFSEGETKFTLRTKGLRENVG